MARMSHTFPCIEPPIFRWSPGLLESAFQQLFQMDILHML